MTVLLFLGSTTVIAKSSDKAKEIIDIIHKVNSYWQTQNPKHGNSFWHYAAYHTGNMEAYFLTGNGEYLRYSEAWANQNEWKGAKSDNRSEWKLTYGETDQYVLFGDFQICFQVYADLYKLSPADYKIARALEVMEYQMSLDRNDFWWWADGLYMVMPVMTRLHRLTGNNLYLKRLSDYLHYADSIMFDQEEGLYYRDHKYVYPSHKTVNGKKDFWARGDGWVLAGFARVLQDFPLAHKDRQFYVDRFRSIAKAVAKAQQPEGYWTRSMLDPAHASGPETSGTAFFTYGLLWGVNNGILEESEYGSVIEKAWNYLSNTALQPDGRIGYVQPIGERADQHKDVGPRSTADFGVGAFLLAACEYARKLGATTAEKESFGDFENISEVHQVSSEGAWCWFGDPRALHYKSENGNINKTYIGYIDIHGNIKAMQYDFNKNMQEEILIRSCFQPDDHNNPTFLVLPDERIMIFYSRHTDEPCFYYRVSREPGDITTLGEEKRIETENNTTYPSPFILSDDPNHFYLCWRGIGWHPTIARLSLPDSKDNVTITWGPHQIVQSTGARPYAKYASNGKDKIYMTYTTGHPDNELPNFIYFNYININSQQLEDIDGNILSNISEKPFRIDKSDEYVGKYPNTVVDNSPERDWVWQIAMDSQEKPVIAMVRINEDKNQHAYYYVRWTGKKWRKSFLADAGGHFHQSDDIEKCYSGGMTIDPTNTNIIYCSVPQRGKYGNVYEIIRYTLDEDGRVVSKEAMTNNSPLNNVRPYLIPGSENTPLRLTWMHGNYYDWIVSAQRPQGFCTSIYCDFEGFHSKTEVSRESTLSNINKKFKFNPKKDFDLSVIITPNTANYQGHLLQLGDLDYCLNGETVKPEIIYKGKVYQSSNILGTSENWRKIARGTNGKWYSPEKPERFLLRIKYKDGILSTYINGLLDQRIDILNPN